MEERNIEQLNQEFREAEQVDDDVFAEMRSNLLLVSGNHYSKKSDQFFSNLRNSNKIPETQKLRLTKNHIHRITRHYIHAISSKAPGVIPVAANEMEMQDKKVADLNLAVWNDIRTKCNLKEKQNDLFQNFIEVGEMCVYIYWNPYGGKVKGYEPMVDDFGQPVFDEMGQPMQDQSKPIYSGQLEYKNIPAYNLLRAPQAKSMKESPYHIIREFVDKKELMAAYGDDPEKMKIIGEGDQGEFVVFDNNKKAYSTEKNQILIRYHFYKPCRQYPNGHYCIATERGILEGDELPFGIYPIIWQGFDTYSSNPRGFSIVKIARPYQAEINRASSQAASHQIPVGDDKIIYQAGTKLAPGALLPGVRGLTFQGAPPQILPGRDGGQFLPYISAQISEMYSACMMEEVAMEREAQLDPYTLLFRSATQKAKFGRYIEKAEQFLKEMCMISLELAKKYYPDDEVVKAVGKTEAINIPEFKSTELLSNQIRIEELSQDISDLLGKQLSLNHLVQYAGAQMDPKQLALLAREMPYLKNTPVVKRLTIDYDNADNDMLQIERGQLPFISPYVDNKVYADCVSHRMKQPDFQLLPQQIQSLYDQYLQIHEDEIARKAQAEQSAKDGFIPTDGSLVTLQGVVVPDPSSSSGTRQVRLPYASVMWLVKRIESQGVTVNDLENMNDGVVAEAMQRIGAGKAAGNFPQQGLPPPPPQMPPPVVQ